ncbi:MAG: hypothetical protein A2735_03205 [Candidatus Yanofskybacteria bacterium RIFCSPHIGHO2_01_FULL_41_21]|uniref:SbsA Ig-like domain-containing protein n=1 Tax=Candidatus Yanofskybacteria bacterium RIFCSPHIGHO2_01_FULL_41_21 TaxID=1802660 RepID=A0A1F8E8Y4_9BACT|nr:MAG: hypothetical protein A2735_03205 [Candidatus Yanofskybacteria bacterium RIFCSPHIGHO2_01_FULL_41_21]
MKKCRLFANNLQIQQESHTVKNITGLRRGGVVSKSVIAVVMTATFLMSGFFAPNNALAVISSIDVTYPAASDIYVKGTFNITWAAAGEPDDLVDIYYSTNDFGISTKLTASGIDYDAGTYAWNTTSPAIPDGASYKIKVKSTSNDINGISANTFTIDNTLPTVPTVLTPNGGQVLKGGDDYDITWTSSVDTNFSATPIKIEYSKLGDFSDTTTVVAATANDGSYTWSLPTDDTTTAKIRVTATDLAGNTGSDLSNATFTIDSTAPTIPVTTLTGTTVQADNDTITIVFSEPVLADDGTWSTNEFSAIESPDGTVLDLTGAVFGYAGSTLTITLSEANEYLQNGDFVAVTAVAGKIKDPAGNALAAIEVIGTVAVTGDVAAPTVALTYNPDRPVKDADTVTITATFNETILGTPQIAIATAGDGDVAATGMSTTADPLIWTYSWNVPSGTDDDGLATITISGVTDLAGNANAVASNNTRTVDNTAPSVSSYTLNGATAHTYFNPALGTVQIHITASEAVHFNRIRVCANGDAVCNDGTALKYFTQTTSFSSLGSKTWDGYDNQSTPVIAPDGVYKLNTNLEDEAGNVATVILTTYLITVDTADPTFSAFNAPATDAVYKTNTPLQFTPDDSATAVTCAYKIDTSSYISVDCTAATPFSDTIPDGSLSDGRHTVTIKVVDAANNSLESSPVSFVFDNNNTLTVDDDGIAFADFSTISEAITKSTTNDTINVAAGSYGNSLTVNKTLTINGGVGGETSTQTAAVSITADNVTLDNFTFTGNLGGDAFINLDNDTAHSGISLTNNTFDGAITTWHVIRAGGNKDDLTITGNTFTGSTSGNDNALILLGVGGSNINVSTNIFESFPSTYSLVAIQHSASGGARTDGLTISGNSFDYTGYTNAGNGSEAISVRYADNVTVNGNILTGSASDTTYEAGITLASVTSTGGQSVISGNTVNGFSRGIRIQRWSGGDGFADDVEITNNTVTDGVSNDLNYGAASTGAGLFLVGLNITVNNNTITGNDNFGVYIPATAGSGGANDITGLVIGGSDTDFNKIFDNGLGVKDELGDSSDAEYNWWGDMTGPEQTTSNPLGTGNGIDDSDSVDYSPWCLDDTCSDFGSSDPIDHFDIDPSVGSAIVNVPITLTVTAKDAADITRVNDVSVVSMAADHGASLGTLLLTLISGTRDTTVTNSVTGTVNVSGIKVGGTATGSTSVSFTSSDPDAPTISSHTPADDATSISVSTALYIIFSEALKASTVNSTNIQLKKYSDNSTVAATISLVEGGTKVVITPTSDLDYLTQYYFAVSTSVQDEVGNALASALDVGSKDAHEFTTVADTADHTAPTVSSHFPLDNATDISVNVAPYIIFSEALKASTVNSTNIQLKKYSDDSTVAATISLVEGGTRVIITPTSALDTSVQYYFAVSTAVQDDAGNALASALDVDTKAVHEFTTAVDTADHTAPVIASHTPADNATDIAITTVPYITFSEALKASTVNSTNIQLKKYSDDSTVSATVSLVEGGTRVNITPDSSLANNTKYYFAVSTAVQDEAGNALATALDVGSRDSHEFTTVAVVPFVVDDIVAQSSTAEPDNTYVNGWHYTYYLTINATDETELFVKFDDWLNTTDGVSKIEANGNMRVLFNSITGGGLGSIVGSLTESDIVNGFGDVDSYEIGNDFTDQLPSGIETGTLDTGSASGRQIRFDVFTKIPTDTVAGAYEADYTLQLGN